MDISRASNFERFMFDVVGRDGAKLRALWQAVDDGDGFDLGETALVDTERAYAFVSGSSTHANRIATIRDIYQRFGVIVDTHTADGIKVGFEHREQGVPLICLETAQPVKFADVIKEALGREPECPASCRGLEKLPQRVAVMSADDAAIKDYIARRCDDK
jgi:threonine synthase